MFVIAEIGDWIIVLVWAVVIVGSILKKVSAAPKAPPQPRHLERPPPGMPPEQGPAPMLGGPGRGEKPSEEDLRKFLRDLSRRPSAPPPSARPAPTRPPSQARRPSAGPAHPQSGPLRVKQAQRKGGSLVQPAQAAQEKKEKKLGTIRPPHFEDISASFEMGFARDLQSLEEISGRKLTGLTLAPAEKGRAAAAAVSAQKLLEERLSSLNMVQRGMLCLEIFGPPRALRPAGDPYSF